MGLPFRGPHRHRGKEVNDGSLFVFGARCRQERSRGLRRRAGDGHRQGPSPHASSKKEREAGSRLERQSPTESGRSQRLVVLYDSRRSRLFDSSAGAHHGVFFPSARSIVLGWTSTENSSRTILASSRARMGSPSMRCFSTKARTAPWSLCGPRGPLFFGTSPATPAPSKFAFAW